ncbi:MAG: cobalamin-binding protein [Dehalococcoidia bacterium]|nr:cobalamin-binding protein [Dehalococcoidia bacterium]
MRIVSLLPSATEIVCFLGLADQLVGITHECDYPDNITGRPKLTTNIIDHSHSTPLQIDKHIKESIHTGSSIYQLNRGLLDSLNPDLILTQELCDVCAVSYNEVERAVKELYGERSKTLGTGRVLSLDPVNIQEVLESIITVGRTVGVEVEANSLVAGLQKRIDRVVSMTRNLSYRPRVYCMEWFDPPYSAGHWVPGMVAIAGGAEVVGRAEEPSFVVNWDEIAAAQPEFLILMPCGYDLSETIQESRKVSFPDSWQDLPAVKSGNVYALNGSAYYNRPGPRLVDGLEILAQILHPELQICDIRKDHAAKVSL